MARSGFGLGLELGLSMGFGDNGDGLQGARLQTGILARRGGWSKELERCTIAPLLVESFRLKVEAERDIWIIEHR